MKVVTGHSVLTDASLAVEEAWQQVLSKLDAEPQLVICHASANYTANPLQQALLHQIPDSCRLSGSSSCLGAMNEQGFHSDAGVGLSLMVFSEDTGDFGVGLVCQSSEPQQAAANALNDAIADAGRQGELPDLIWMNAAPGQEELLLDGIANVVGSHVPVVGGSSADNEIKGDWWQFSNQSCEDSGVLMIAFYPECKVDVSFHSGYAPTRYSGVATSVDGRVVHAIDGEPAAEVYNRWSGGNIASKLQGGNILQDSTFSPLGVEVGNIEGIPYYALKHPEQVLENGALHLFADVKVGDTLTLMEGSVESLTKRAGSVVGGLMARKAWSTEHVAGALVVYCAGCMLGVRDNMHIVNQGLRAALGDASFQAVFTFGEQGCLMDGMNQHGNLMISVVIFANRQD